MKKLLFLLTNLMIISSNIKAQIPECQSDSDCNEDQWCKTTYGCGPRALNRCYNCVNRPGLGQHCDLGNIDGPCKNGLICHINSQSGGRRYGYCRK